MSLPNPRDGSRGERVRRLLAWCDRLEAVRDSARAEGNDFLAYLVEAALEHAIALAMRENAGRVPSEPDG